MSEAEQLSEGRAARGASRARDPLLGRIVGAYRIQERVGEGTGLPSYLAEHVHLDRQVLFKLFHPPRDGGESEAVRGAIQQARELSALKHEGVLPLVEISECGDGFMYVVLELSGARPLPSVLAEGGPLSWPTARTLGRQVAAALLAAQAVSLASTEPTASQIFVEKSASGELRARVDLVTPEALGWVPARAPDQVRAVGHLLYAMLAGHEPASAEEQPPPDLVLSFPDHDIPSVADALVMRALEAEPSRRWPDLGTLHRELGGRDEPSQNGIEGVGSSRSSGAQGGPMDAEEDGTHDDATFGRRFFTRPSRRALIAGGVGVAVAIVVALAVVSGSGDSDTATFESAANSKIKLTPPPAPTPMVVPPPPVPDPEPESPQGPHASVVSASSENAEAEADPAKEPSTGGEAEPAAAAPATVAPVAGGPAARSAAAPAEPAAAIVPAASTSDRGVNTLGSPSPAVKNPAPSLAPPQRAPGAPAALAARAPAKAMGGSARPPAPAAVGSASTAGSAAPAGALAAAVPAPSAQTAVPSPAPVAATPTKEGGGQPCTLSLGSIPWSDVQVDGQRAGFTPLTDLPVACGTHEILFTSPDRGLERRITLTVRPGEKLKRIVDLGGPKTPAGAPGASTAARPACRVTLGSRPWSEIWIDGRRAGTTPLVDYPIACGTHDVLFLSREANVQHRESLNVQSTLKKVITLVEATD